MTQNINAKNFIPKGLYLKKDIAGLEEWTLTSSQKEGRVYEVYTKNIAHKELSWRFLRGVSAFAMTFFSLGLGLLSKHVKRLWNQSLTGTEIVKIKVLKELQPSEIKTVKIGKTLSSSVSAPVSTAVPSSAPASNLVNPLDDLSHLLAVKYGVCPSDDGQKNNLEIKRNKPFMDWISCEYKPAAHIRKNLEALIKEDRPELQQALFIGIRGDGDCTSRAIGIGLLLHAGLQEHPINNLQKFYEKLQVIQTMIEQETQQSDNDLTKEIRLLQPRLIAFVENISLLISSCTKANAREKILLYCQQESFNQEMILFLKVASSLYLITHRQELPDNHAYILTNQIQDYCRKPDTDIADELVYFRDKIKMSASSNPTLHSTTADAYALNHLFDYPIYWLRVEREWSGRLEARPTIIFNSSNTDTPPLYILNRDGHCDLLLNNFQ
jgi:hypothetical protein